MVQPLARLRTAFLLAGAVLQPLAMSSAQAPSCDAQLVKRAPRVNGYRQRGDRCEGIYERQVAGTDLFLASLTESFEDYRVQVGDTLSVAWPVVGDSGVRLRAESLKRGRFYRMETARPRGASSYHWPAALLAAEQIPRRDLGVLGWTRQPIGGTTALVYVPLRIQHRSPAQCGSYQLVLWPGERLTEVYISLAPLGPDGQPAAFIKKDEPLNRGFYPAENPITIRLQRVILREAGVYYLKIAAGLTGGRTTTKEYLVRFPGRETGTCP